MIRIIMLLVILLAGFSPCAVHAQADTSASAANATMAELLRLREEIDSINALLNSYGISRFKNKYALKFSFTSDVYYNENHVSNTNRLNVKFVFNRRRKISPYIGIDIGALFLRWVGSEGNLGIEKSFIYNNGFSITPSLGMHGGDYSLRSGNSYFTGGGHALLEFAVSQKRSKPYVIVGMKHLFLQNNKHYYQSVFGVGWSFRY